MGEDAEIIKDYETEALLLADRLALRMLKDEGMSIYFSPEECADNVILKWLAESPSHGVSDWTNLSKLILLRVKHFAKHKKP